MKNEGGYKEFRIGDLFDIHPTKSYGMTNDKLFQTQGKVPVVANSSVNNGIGGWVDLAATENGNLIVYSDTTTSDAIFYQPFDFIGYSHVQGLYPFDDLWNENTNLYFVTTFRKSASGKFSYGNKFSRKIAACMKVSLPVTGSGEIDFEYMENYIQKIINDRLFELDSFLEANKLKNCTLNEDEKKSLDDFENNKIQFEDFKIGDLFLIYSPKKRFNANTIKFDGIYPYVARGTDNNGIRGYITQDLQFLTKGNTISFGQDTATIYYQKDDYFTGDKIKIMKYINFDLNENIAIFLITVMRKAFTSFAWGTSSFNESILNNVKIKLPINYTCEINYNFMENYISAQKKLAVLPIIKSLL